MSPPSRRAGLAHAINPNAHSPTPDASVVILRPRAVCGQKDLCNLSGVKNEAVAGPDDKASIDEEMNQVRARRTD